MSVNSSNVLSVIMGGGQGTRLFPLTKERANRPCRWPGKYRLVDIPISNCINSGLRRIYLLTQFNSASLHRHISQSYKFDHFTGGFVEILAAEQTLSDTSWYQGTADAVRKNLIHFLNHDFDYLLILSGDQLYRMDFRHIIAQHAETGADITVATIPVPRSEAAGLGIMQIDAELRITRFVEKPKDPAVLDSLAGGQRRTRRIWASTDERDCSWPRWAFTSSTARSCCKLLDNTLTDFGKHIIPSAIEIAQGPRLRLPGLLGGHRDHPLLFRGEPRFGGGVAAFQFLRHGRAHFHPAALFARLQDQRRRKSTTPSFPTAASSTIATSRHSIVGVRSIIHEGCNSEPRPSCWAAIITNRTVSIRQHESRGLPRIGIGRIRTSKTPSSTKTRASGLIAEFLPPANRTKWIIRCTTSATASSSSPRTPSYRGGRSSKEAGRLEPGWRIAN